MSTGLTQQSREKEVNRDALKLPIRLYKTDSIINAKADKFINTEHLVLEVKPELMSKEAIKNESDDNQKCPICQIKFQHDIAYISKCGNCGLLHSSLQAGTGRGKAGLQTLREANFHKILDRTLPRLAKNARILEIGSGDGWFLDICRQRGVMCIGIEPYVTQDLLERHPDILQIEFPCQLADVGDRKFDAIVFNDVLEHLHDLEAVLTCCRSLLIADGILLINIPSSRGIFYRLARLLARFGMQESLDRLWQQGLVSPHIWYFHPENLPKLMGVKPLFQMRLRTVSLTGLKSRIAFPHSTKATPLIKYLAVVFLSILSPLFPGDIMFQCYRIGQELNANKS